MYATQACLVAVLLTIVGDVGFTTEAACLGHKRNSDFLISTLLYALMVYVIGTDSRTRCATLRVEIYVEERRSTTSSHYLRLP